MKKIKIVSAGAEHISADETNLEKALGLIGADCEIVDWNDSVIEDDAVYVFRSCWDYHLKADAFRDFLYRLENSSAIAANPVDAILWNMDKAYLLELERQGIRIAKTFYCASDAEMEAAKEYFSARGGPVIVKPAISASAHLTVRYEAAKDIALIVNSPTLVQEYLPEIESIGESSLTFLNGEFAHAILKNPAKGDYRVQSKYGGRKKPHIPGRAALEISANILGFIKEKFHAYPAYARLDLIETGETPILMECELIEPHLALDLHPATLQKFAENLRQLAI